MVYPGLPVQIPGKTGKDIPEIMQKLPLFFNIAVN